MTAKVYILGTDLTWNLSRTYYNVDNETFRMLRAYQDAEPYQVRIEYS